MENKYYTPSIEEFHVGFEYEVNLSYMFPNEVDDPTWKSYKFSGMAFNIDLTLQLDNNTIRVKHLDREDIESLLNEAGETAGHEGKIYFSSNKSLPLLFDLNPSTGELIIEEVVSQDVLFVGILKNKSAFKIILTQTGIL